MLGTNTELKSEEMLSSFLIPIEKNTKLNIEQDLEYNEIDWAEVNAM